MRRTKEEIERRRTWLGDYPIYMGGQEEEEEIEDGKIREM